MNFLGLIGYYPKQRLLTDLERSQWLDQKRRLDVNPRYQLSVIRMNSCYLETVDKWYAWKGLLTGVGSAIACIFFYGLFAVGFASDGIAWDTMTADEKFEQMLFVSAIALLSLPLIWLGAWLVKKEAFAYTHYPIRFNFRSRTVHVFRTDGTVLTVPWEQVFFTLGHLRQWNEWEIRGNVLESDRATVRETFALSYVGSLSTAGAAAQATQYSTEDFVRAHWEFIRRFMEDGPASVVNQVQFCMPVDGRRESVRLSLERVLANFSGVPLLFYGIVFPFCLVVSAFRVIAMRTGKIPEWPEDVEESCMVEPDDPYAIVGGPNAERLAVCPEAATAAGACYRAPVHPQASNNRRMFKRGRF